MAIHSVKHSESSWNISSESKTISELYDLSVESLDKAYALVQVALSEHFASCSVKVIHDYLWTLDSLIFNVRELFKTLCKKIEDDASTKPILPAS
jgi:hypothetical protein